VECGLAPGKGVNEPEEFDVSSLPGISVTPGAAKSATTFNLGPLKAALGKYAAMPVFFVNYGDGTGYGSSSDLRSLNSFPSSHIYVQAGTYTITGYAVADGRTESTTMAVVIEPANQPDPTPDKVSSGDWDPAATPKANALIPVASTSSAGGLSIGTGGSVIAEATSNAPSASASKAPVVNARANQVVIVSVPSLQTGTDVVGRVRFGTTWRTLPKAEVGDGGVLTLPALTFSKAGTYSVKLSLETGGSRYVTVKVKK
jgi:PKD repeat protein